ncbi:MAG: hypothetical protein L3J93_01030 [Thermoplasmata archaeon]|nr:hypothetical protein [Thermoplasmata archaeon]
MATYDAPFRRPTWLAASGIVVVLAALLWGDVPPAGCAGCAVAPAVLTTFLSLGSALILVGIAYGWAILVLQLRPRRIR